MSFMQGELGTDYTITITKTRREPNNVLAGRRFDMKSDLDDIQAQVSSFRRPACNKPSRRHPRHPVGL